MAFSEENVLKTLIIQEIEGISITITKIRQDFDLSNDYFKNLPQITTEVLSNKNLYKENLLDQMTTIKTTLYKIRNSTIRFKRLIENTKLQSLNHLAKNDLNHQLNEIATTLNIIREKQVRLSENSLNTIQNIDIHIKKFGNSTQISNELSNKIEKICTYNKDIIISLNYVYDVLSSIHESIERHQSNITENNNLNYIDRFKEDTDLIIKKYQNEITNLTEKFENQFKKFELNQNKVVKSSDLLSTGVDAGLKNLAELNERTQNIELEFSKIIGTETDKVKADLNNSKIALTGVVESITMEANTKLNEINTAHSDFLSIVSKSGAHELTKNYKEKAEEEKTEYKDFRKYTAWSIMAAIGSTLLIFVIAFLEHYFSDKGNQTNYLLLASRLSISVMFFVLAFYLSKQAAKHYECYQENHRTFLQLAALEPFMARMNSDEQMEIRKGLIPSYFSQSSDSKFAAKGDEVDLPTNIHAIVNRAFDLLGEKKDPKPPENTAAETKPQV